MSYLIIIVHLRNNLAEKSHRCINHWVLVNLRYVSRTAECGRFIVDVGDYDGDFGASGGSGADGFWFLCDLKENKGFDNIDNG